MSVQSYFNYNNLFMRPFVATNSRVHVIPPIYAQLPLKTRVLRFVLDLDAIPFFIQRKADQIGSYIDNKFATVKEYRAWLDTHYDDWKHNITTALIKLPLKEALTIIDQLYNVISEILYVSNHPWEARRRLGPVYKKFIEEISKPETWSKTGACLVGASIGQSLTNGLFFSAVGAAIGSALVFGGLSFDVLKAAYEAESGKKHQAAKERFCFHAPLLAESFVEGVVAGLVMGGIERFIQVCKMNHFLASGWLEKMGWKRITNVETIAPNFIYPTQLRVLYPFRILNQFRNPMISKWGPFLATAALPLSFSEFKERYGTKVAEIHVKVFGKEKVLN